ncbi:COG3650 family protein [Thaumasiovibrio subtropicus]|uniref:COG3650 family protein n=1 Tax=Thaumasiovibrio subtropicus TaxID=1891207 RepID=UPI00131DAEE8|nr:hypothetical protein [Thaumasiovibrio subtropicus]
MSTRNTMLTASFIAVMLSACSQTPAPIAESATPMPPQPKAIGNQYTSQAFMLRGEVVIGHESYYIQPCGSPVQYWLRLPESMRQSLQNNGGLPYSPFYGELIGHLIPSPTEGFASGHPAQFVVKQVNQLSLESPGCQRAAQPTRAFGTEPAWVIEANNAQLTLAQLGYPDIELPLNSIEQHPNQRIYHSDNLKLTLDKGLCRDGMSDNLYGWRALVTEPGKGNVLKGCATLDGLDPTLPWVGTYQGQTTQLTTTLELNNDHTATTTYQYPTDEPALVEKGFWQQHDEDSVQVIMTSHNGQRLLSERLYHRQGYQLSTQEEYVNNQHYAIGQGLKLDLMIGDVFSATATPQLADLQAGEIASRRDTHAQVEAAIRRYVTAHKADPNGLKYQWLKYDLNRDGEDDLLVMLDWCSAGGCTLLVFEGKDGSYAFSSRVANVHPPISVGYGSSEGWQDLILAVGGGGAKPASRVLQYSGFGYPFDPAQAPKTEGAGNAIATLFVDGAYPRNGHKL